MNLSRIEACSNQSGFSLVETLVTLAIFSIITAGIFSAFDLQVKSTVRESFAGESEIEFNVAKGLLVRDLETAGYGLADDYGPFGFAPLAYNAVNGANDPDTDPDELLLMGTALGVKSRQAQGWTYVEDPATPSFANWTDTNGTEDYGLLVRDRVQVGDRVLLMDPSSKTLLSQNDGTNDFWLYEYKGAGSAPQALPQSETPTATLTYPTGSRYLVYGLYGSSKGGDNDSTARPYYTVKYDLGGTSPDYCASGTQSLLRAEDVTSEDPPKKNPLLNCVLDFQVAFGVDRDENGVIETWDDGGKDYVSGYSLENQKKRLKQIRVYLLVQQGRRDTSYTFPQSSLRVGEILSAGGTSYPVGREVNLSDEQRKYRWRLVTLNITPRNNR